MRIKINNTDIFEVIKHLKNYFNATVANKALGFISIPILTRLLTTEDYGMLNTYTSYVAIFTVIITLNSYTSVSRYYYEDESDIPGFVGTTVILCLGCLLFSLFPLLLLKKEISNLTGIPEFLILFLIPQVIFMIISSLFSQIKQCEKKSGLIALTQIVQNYSGFLISVFLVYLISDNKYLGCIYGTIITASIMSIYFIYNLRNYFRVTFKKEFFIYIVKYSIPLIPYVLGASILAQFDRIMISNINGQSQAGLYSLAYNITMIVPIFLVAVQNAIYPDFFKFVSEGQYNRIFSLDKKLYSIVLIFCLSIIYYGYEITYILADPKFHSALPIMPIIVISYIFLAISNVYSRYLSYEKRTIWMSVSFLIPGIINILLNSYYLPRFGYVAGAYTTLVSYFILMMLSYGLSKIVIRNIDIIPISSFIRGTVIFFIFAGSFFIFQSMNFNIILGIIIKFFVLIGFSIILFWKEVNSALIS